MNLHLGLQHLLLRFLEQPLMLSLTPGISLSDHLFRRTFPCLPTAHQMNFDPLVSPASSLSTLGITCTSRNHLVLCRLQAVHRWLLLPQRSSPLWLAPVPGLFFLQETFPDDPKLPFLGVPRVLWTELSQHYRASALAFLPCYDGARAGSWVSNSWPRA